jgi:gamma-aminobutyric acid type B receptor
MVSSLLIVDIVILITWQIQDPLARTLETFPLEDPISVSDDIKIRPELEHCESENNSVWLGKFLLPLQSEKATNNISTRIE